MIKKKLSNLLGWRTNRKIIVIESDDWGSFRFKNIETRNKFLSLSDKDKCWMSYNDCFESAEDIEKLLEVLTSVNDKNGKTAKFTFLMNPSNPDFKKIKNANFKQFYQESFLQTLKKRSDGQEILDLYKDGLSKDLIEVAFHGREHLNVNLWMKDLQEGDKIAHLGFENNMWGFSKSYIAGLNYGYRATFDIKNLQELPSLENNIKEGIAILNKTFNQNTTYFLPPNGPYHLVLNKELIENGIKFIGLSKLHQNPTENGLFKKHLFWVGKKIKTGLTVITRNVIFEPGSPKHKDWVTPALMDIENAFNSKKPAIISSHRVNYIGSLNEENRSNGLRQLKELLNKITEKWPDIEFMTSSELGELIQRKND
jgi:hypothetical protein